MIGLIAPHEFLSSCPIITLLGPLFLLIAIVPAVYYLRISRRLHFQVALQEQTDVMLRKLSSAVESSPTSIFITDKKGLEEYVNPAFVWMTGSTPEKVLGHIYA